MRNLPANTGFEWLYDLIETMEPASNAESRTLKWVTENQSLALARDENGGLEIYISGPPLTVGSRKILEHLTHKVVDGRDGETTGFSSLTLPEASEYDGLAALICDQLIRNGIDEDRQAAVTRAEPTIDFAFTRSRRASRVLLGLAGELYSIWILVQDLPPLAAGEIVHQWYGYKPSSRDIQLGALGIEIKTTTSTRSRHQIQGIHQVELGYSVDNVPEAELILLSVGLRWLSDSREDSHSINQLVGLILDVLPGAQKQDFIRAVGQYGGDNDVAYDYNVSAESRNFERPFVVNFLRAYDLNDPAISLLGSQDIGEITHVVAESVTYTVDLPDSIEGSENPISGTDEVVGHILGVAGYGS